MIHGKPSFFVVCPVARRQPATLFIMVIKFRSSAAIAISSFIHDKRKTKKEQIGKSDAREKWGIKKHSCSCIKTQRNLSKNPFNVLQDALTNKRNRRSNSKNKLPKRHSQNIGERIAQKEDLAKRKGSEDKNSLKFKVEKCPKPAWKIEPRMRPRDLHGQAKSHT